MKFIFIFLFLFACTHTKENSNSIENNQTTNEVRKDPLNDMDEEDEFLINFDKELKKDKSHSEETKVRTTKKESEEEDKSSIPMSKGIIKNNKIFTPIENSGNYIED
jgi:hypothetical protein